MINNLRAYAAMTASLQALERGDFSRAVRKADSAKKKLGYKLDFFDAYYARLLMNVGRHDEALAMLRKIVSAKDDGSKKDDREYILAYAKTWVALYESNDDAHQLRSQMGVLSPRKNIVRYLPAPSKEDVEVILDAASTDRA